MVNRKKLLSFVRYLFFSLTGSTFVVNLQTTAKAEVTPSKQPSFELADDSSVNFQDLGELTDFDALNRQVDKKLIFNQELKPQIYFNRITDFRPVLGGLGESYSVEQSSSSFSRGQDTIDLNKPSQSLQVYRVNSGDTLFSIARRHNISLSALITYNNHIKVPDLIFPGDIVYVPKISSLNNSQDFQSQNLSPHENKVLSKNNFNPKSGKIVGKTTGKNKNEVFKGSILANLSNRDGLSLKDSNILTSLHNSSNFLHNTDEVSILKGERVRIEPSFTVRTYTGLPDDIFFPKVRELKPLNNPESQNLGDSSLVFRNEKPVSNRAFFNNNNPLVFSLLDLNGLLRVNKETRNFSNNSFYGWPVRGGVLTSRFGDWRPSGRKHMGIDIAAPVGTPIFASAAGRVISSGWNAGGYGNLVVIEHSDGSLTYYAHNKRNIVVKGQFVERGQLIAEVGSTGFSTGPHLHFEIRKFENNTLLHKNPLTLLAYR